MRRTQDYTEAEDVECRRSNRIMDQTQASVRTCQGQSRRERRRGSDTDAVTRSSATVVSKSTKRPSSVSGSVYGSVTLLLLCSILLSRPAHAQFPTPSIFTPPPIPVAPPIPQFEFPTVPPVTSQPFLALTRSPTVQPTLDDRQLSPGPAPGIPIPVEETDAPTTRAPTPPPSPGPSPRPTRIPTRIPTPLPSLGPTPNPTSRPTNRPTRIPTSEPTNSPTLGPTNRPTLGPTSGPTFIPTLGPSLPPSPRPSPRPSTMRPTRNPTPLPSLGPTPRPSMRPITIGPTTPPSMIPTRIPTQGPTNEPTNSPTRLPTTGPTLQPTNSPTRIPTWRPTPGPTVGPTQAPSASPSREPSSSPTNVASAGPSSAPTPETASPTVSAMPSPQPSQFPSDEPSDYPSSLPSVTPSVPPTDMPTNQPTSSPSLSLQSDLVNVVMVLTATRARLASRSAIDWESATAAHIRQSISNTDFGDFPLFDLRVGTNIIRQLPLANGGDLVLAPDDSTAVPTSAPSPNSSVRKRVLQESTLLPLQIVFDVAVSFRSLGQDYDAVDMVGDAFNSEEDRASYTQRLKQTMNAAFDDVTQVRLLVEGIAPQEEVPENIAPSDSNLWVIVGAAAGASLVMILAGVFVLRNFGNGGGKNNQLGPNTASVSEVRMGVSTEILVERQDDISTLGDPTYGGTLMNMGAPLQRDERTASVGDDYDYAKYLGANPGGDPLSVADSRSRLTSTDSGRGSRATTGPLNNTVFSDDESFEQQYSAAEDKFEVTVPAGKLGMVIDTPNGGVPVVHAIKTESILSTTVRVGDKLVSVDGEDVTAMTAVQVSKLISLKSDQQRVLAFIRIRAPDGSQAP